MSDAARDDLSEIMVMLDEIIGFSDFTIKERSATGMTIQTAGRYYRIDIKARAAPKPKREE
jgi:hypothetical protein